MAYNNRTATVALGTRSVQLSRPEAAKFWRYMLAFLGEDAPNEAVVVLEKGDLRLETKMKTDDIGSLVGDLVQFLTLSRVGAESRGEPATTFDHPATRWTTVQD